MKLRIDTQPLAAALGWAAKHLPARPAIPVLMGLQLDADDGRLRIEAFDFEVAARTYLQADVQQTGTVLAPGRMLAAIAGRLAGDQTQLTLDGTTLTVEAGAASFRLQTLPIEDYPKVPALPDPAGTINGSDLATAISRVVPAAGRDATVPVLTSVRFQFSDDALDLAATDRYRAATTHTPWQPTPKRKTAKATSRRRKTAPSASEEADTTTALADTALVPWQTATDIAKTLAKPPGRPNGAGHDDGHDGRLTLALTRDETGRPSMLAVSTPGGDRELITRLLDGDFVDLDKLMPTEFTCRARVDTSAMLSAVRRLAAVAERNTPIRLDFTAAGHVALGAGSGDDVQGTDTVPCDLDGQPLVIAFNPGYLTDALTTMHTTNTQFAFTALDRPAIITPHDNDNDQEGDQEQPGYRHLLMPVRPTG